MYNAVIVDAEFIDNQTLHLLEPVDGKNEKVKVIIEIDTSLFGQRKFGCAKDWLEISPDFDEPLEDFKEYME